ncbi:metal-dependent transcriptional regulator [Prosthecochloris sp. SCSIO W1102]|uniref:metal-dependent transcriptional regulator n=1 Tax=Prosthecochloris sp. SCSIO W1102 TaxID=2992243 RepID=UPI00223DB875|nr:metal-dependent transcriptional regulator [Prosthecochloris sp. SCSIO W1102]UZJ39858.1 metal-dependent transcriptional regulator [Prosthecochloris sp. SCSIO W1102]
MLSESSEMYIQTVFRLSEKNGEVTIGMIAEAMGYSLSTVSEKVKKLTDQGLLLHEWREGVALSNDGKRLAAKLLRKRRLVETFLVRMAGYSPYEVHEDACRLEHVVSERLTDALDKMLGYPARDPHGHPIPSAEGELNGRETVPLSAIAPGSQAKVSAICTTDIEKMKYINQLGFLPDNMCRVIEKAPFDGPVMVAMNGKNVPVSLSLASLIEVETFDS